MSDVTPTPDESCSEQALVDRSQMSEAGAAEGDLSTREDASRSGSRRARRRRAAGVKPPITPEAEAEAEVDGATAPVRPAEARSRGLGALIPVLVAVLLLGIVTAAALLSLNERRDASPGATTVPPVAKATTIGDAKARMSSACAQVSATRTATAQATPDAKVDSYLAQVAQATADAESASGFTGAPPVYHLITANLKGVARAQSANEVALQLQPVEQLCRQSV